MGQILVKDIDDATIAKLRDRAARHARTLEAEACAILEGAAVPYDEEEMTEEERVRRIEAFRASTLESLRDLSGIHHTDSAILVRETRDDA